jgi:hypothetical protein
MSRQNRDIKIQVRVTADEKNMLDKMLEADREFSISKLVREAINARYKEYQEGIGSFTIG